MLVDKINIKLLMRRGEGENCAARTGGQLAVENRDPVAYLRAVYGGGDKRGAADRCWGLCRLLRDCTGPQKLLKFPRAEACGGGSER